jgi:hypothetical protein
MVVIMTNDANSMMIPTVFVQFGLLLRECLS